MSDEQPPADGTPDGSADGAPDGAVDGTPDGAVDGAVDGTEAKPPATGPTRRAPAPTAAASAASRARRIGGTRPTTGSTSAGSDAVRLAKDSPSASASGEATADGAGTDGAASEKAATDDTSMDEAATASVLRDAPPWLRWIPAAVLSACAIAMIVIVLIAGHGVWYAQPSSSALRDRVLAAAKVCTAATNTYTYQTLSQDEAKGLACSTGKWSDQYRQAIKTIVTPTATRLKASQAVQINAAGIESVSSSGRDWQVVVYGQIKVTQAKQSPRLDPFSADVTMRRVSGKWLIARIQLISNAGAQSS